MDNNRRYFIFGGFISLSLFASFLLLFIFMMFSVKKETTYGLKKEKFIAVSIVMPKNITKFTRSLSAPSSSKKMQSKDIDVNDLFSDVWTQKISHKQKKKKVNSKRIADIAKKIKHVDKNSVQSLSEKIEKSEMQNDDKKSQQASSASEVNEYLAKIQSIVYQYFHVPPNSAGNSVKTVIELDPFGRVIDFRILDYSANEALNEEADKIKERLKNVVFPKNPLHTSSRTIVVLISKE